MITVEDLFWIPLLGLIGFFWYFGSQVLRDDNATNLMKPSNAPDDLLEAETDPVDQIMQGVRIETDLTEDVIQRKFTTIIGRTIVEAYYVNINEDNYAFGQFDTVDYALVLKFDNGTYLNWVFSDGTSSNREGGNYVGFYLSFNDTVMTSFEEYEECQDVSGTSKWKDLEHVWEFNLGKKCMLPDYQGFVNLASG
ncbi:MAG: hypothetical protein AAFR36_01620 [Bacteroidota bacterium]